MWFYVEVLDSLGLALCARWQIWVYFHFSTYRQSVKPVPFIEDASFFPLYIFGFFVKNHVCVSMWFYFWVFNSISLINLSVCVPIPCCFYHYCSEDRIRLCFLSGIANAGYPWVISSVLMILICPTTNRFRWMSSNN